MSTISRGFRGRRPDADPSRVPPGQYLTSDFPVLSYGPTPHTPLDRWSFSIDGAVEGGRRWTWDALMALPQETFTVDIHCVTKWSKLDTEWTGVSVDTLLDGIDTKGEYVTAWCDGGYTTNVPLADLTGGRAWIAHAYDGAPLTPEHGGPARLLVPHLYFWKSAKWIRGLTINPIDEPGFWEVNGYHDRGDPWREQRYQGERVNWRTATVRETVAETPTARSLVLEVPGWTGHRAGQHVDVRVTADDGHQAQRSFSIASPPEADTLSLTVERIDGGEVSPYLVDDVAPGDRFEVRGPIGEPFSWAVEEGGPLLLIAGGSGMVPLMAMLRHRAARASTVDTRVLVSVRTRTDAYYAEELAALGPREGLEVRWTTTREPAAPGGWSGRVTAGMLAELGPPPDTAPRAFVCGPTGFVERVATLLVDAGHDPERIRTERFGPS